MNKKLFLILLILPLISFFSGLIFNDIISDEPMGGLLYFIYGLPRLIIIYVIELIILFIFKKSLSGKLDDYKLVLITCAITFLLLYVISGFNDFLFIAARSTNNLSFCYLINDKFYLPLFYTTLDVKNRCIRNVTISVAIKKGDVSACEKFVEEYMRERCYTGMARTKGDPNLCEKINNIEDRDWCYFGVVVETKKLDICERISDQFIKKNCETSYDNTRQ